MEEKDNIEILVQYPSDMITLLEPDATFRYQNPAIADTCVDDTSFAVTKISAKTGVVIKVIQP